MPEENKLTQLREKFRDKLEFLSIYFTDISCEWGIGCEIEQIPLKEAETIPILVELLEDPEYTVQINAVKTIGKLWEELQKAVQQEPQKGSVRETIDPEALIQALQQQAIPAIERQLLGTKRINVQLACIEALTLINAPSAVRILQKALIEIDVIEVRREIIQNLGIMGEVAEIAVPTLVKVLKEEQNLQLRSLAAWALGNIGRGLEISVPALLAAEREARIDFRKKELDQAASAALDKIGSKIGHPTRGELMRIYELKPRK
ncbi:MAG: hypothetical protein GF308_05185 [Candidatus Heimdallarchaeota archaeon]|nr:hypothetical protein [Candidatus Heimdallarchaeota archaeon]